MFKRSAASILTAIAAVTVTAIGPASAVTKVVTDDHGDAPARFDITRATFNNGDTRLSGKAHVDNLRYGGEQYFSFTFSPRNSPDIFFTAFSKLHADNTLTNRLTVFNDIGEVSRIPCNVTGIWSPESDTVKVSIPRSCVAELTGPQFMAAHLGPNARQGSQDHVIARFVRQG
jgi:hypothetical protein